MRALLGCLVLWIGLGPSVAGATDGLQWQWDVDQERRYLIRSSVRFAELFPAQSRLNQNLRLVELQTTAVIRCRTEETVSKRLVELACTFEDLMFRGAAPEQDRNQGLVKVLDEWDKSLLDVTLGVEFSLDGRIRTLDIEGYDARRNRFREIRENLRVLLMRTLAGLELQLPRKGDDRGRLWVQKDSQVFRLPSLVGSFGTARLNTAVVSTDGSVVTIDREGEGSIRSGETVGVDATQGADRARNTFIAQLKGTATFDVSTGELLTHDYAAKAEATASSVLATGVAAPLYIQSVSLKRLAPDRAIELGNNVEVRPGELGI